jgi:hypothetical protein
MIFSEGDIILSKPATRRGIDTKLNILPISMRLLRYLLAVWAALRTRIREAVFTRPFTIRKLPGWLGILLGAISRLASQEERIRQAYHLVREMGGEPEAIVTIIQSPLFSVALVIAGVTYLIFVGEPQQGTQRHPAWPIIGYSVAGICLTAMISVFLWGQYNLSIKQQVSDQIKIVQQQALGGQLFWHLTDIEKFNLGEALDEIKEEDKFVIKLKCLPTSSSSQTYASDLLEVFDKHKWKLEPNCFINDVKRDLMGFYISVPKELSGKNINDLPKDINTLHSTFLKAHIPVIWALDAMKPDEFYLVVGNGPAQ